MQTLADGCTVLAYSKSTNEWIAGDAMGQIHRLGQDEGPRTLVEDKIRSIAINPSSDCIAVAYGLEEKFDLYEFPACKIINDIPYSRRELASDQIEFAEDGQHL